MNKNNGKMFMFSIILSIFSIMIGSFHEIEAAHPYKIEALLNEFQYTLPTRVKLLIKHIPFMLYIIYIFISRMLSNNIIRRNS